VEPIQIGEKQAGAGGDAQVNIMQQAALEGTTRSLFAPVSTGSKRGGEDGKGAAGGDDPLKQQQEAATARALQQVAAQVEEAMQDLIRDKLVVVRHNNSWVEVEIRTDILFASGAAALAPPAMQILSRLGEALKKFPNPIRVEGHTDNVRINTLAFPSNWELSAARAASVVHLFTNRGLDASRLMVVGFGEQHPAQPNTTVEGRNANRRVVLVILSTDAMPAVGSLPASTTAQRSATDTSNSIAAGASVSPATALTAPLASADPAAQ
jgi:chemotaxis protein MotB